MEHAGRSSVWDLGMTAVITCWLLSPTVPFQDWGGVRSSGDFWLWPPILWSMTKDGPLAVGRCDSAWSRHELLGSSAVLHFLWNWQVDDGKRAWFPKVLVSFNSGFWGGGVRSFPLVCWTRYPSKGCRSLKRRKWKNPDASGQHFLKGNLPKYMSQWILPF